jgi:hypothetical protein
MGPIGWPGVTTPLPRIGIGMGPQFRLWNAQRDPDVAKLAGVGPGANRW